MIRRLAVLMAILALAGALLAEQAKPVLLRHHFAAGQVLKYRGKVQGEGSITFMEQRQPVTIAGEFNLTQKVLQVSEDGSARIATTVEGGALVFRTPIVSQRLPISLPTLTQTITPDGRVLKSAGWERSPAEAPRAHINLRRVIEQLHVLWFPDHPVAVSDTWVQLPPKAVDEKPAAEPPPSPAPPPPAAAPSPPPPGGFPAWKFTLMGFERVGDRDCARIRAGGQAPIKDVLPPDPMGDVLELDGREQLETVTDFAFAAGRVARQVASTHTTLHTLTHHASGGQPVTGDTDITAKVTLELR